MRIILFLNRYNQLIIIYLRCQTNKWHSSCRREKVFMVCHLFEVLKKGGGYISLLTNPAKQKGPSQVIGKGLCFSALILSVFIASQSPHPAYAPSPPQWVLPPYGIYPLPGRRLLPWSSQRPLRNAPPCRRHWRL